jgi:hypothetical protein
MWWFYSKQHWRMLLLVVKFAVFNAVFFQPIMFQRSTFQRLLFQWLVLSTGICFNYNFCIWEGEACLAVLCCLYAWPTQSLHSASAPLLFLLSIFSMSYANMEKILHFVYTFTIMSLYNCTVYCGNIWTKPLKHKIFEKWMLCVQVV